MFNNKLELIRLNYGMRLESERVIEVWEYKWWRYIGLIFRFNDFWSKEIKISRHKRANYKRLFYATPLEKIRNDIKRVTPTRTFKILVSKERLENKGCL